MSFSYRRTYRGAIEAVMLDWAGTTMDFGCMAPAIVFVQVYEHQRVPITMDEARAPMGAIPTSPSMLLFFWTCSPFKKRDMQRRVERCPRLLLNAKRKPRRFATRSSRRCFIPSRSCSWRPRFSP